MKTSGSLLTLGLASLLVLLVPGAALATPQPMTRAQIVDLAKSGVGYSYYWGHGHWRTDGTQHGSCSGSCPNCNHSGSYGADCSGFVAKVWQVPSPSPVTADGHPYSTYSFYNTHPYWSYISLGSLTLADAVVYNTGTHGHVVLYDKSAGGGDHYVYEAKGCIYGIRHDLKSFTSIWKGMRRTLLVDTPPPTADPIPEEVAVMSAVWDDGAATSDIDGDGKADFCARGSAGFRCYPSTGTGFAASVSMAQMTSAAGWGANEYNTTIRMADFDGDGKADVCARASDGVHCWNSAGDHWGTGYMGPPLTDALGWKAEQYYSTIRVGDVDGDGKADICARGVNGIKCWLSNGTGFPTEISGPALSDKEGWNKPEYYSTIRLGDVNGDGKADLCARSAAGMQCWLSDGKGFPTQIAGPAFTDASSWNKPQYYMTIRLADVNHDGRADICARAGVGWKCYLSDAHGFGKVTSTGIMSDAASWDNVLYYSTIRLGDVNGDGTLDVCARGAAGMFCWLWGPDGHQDRITGPGWSNSVGWDDPEHWRTIRLADFSGDGKADLCARGNTGVVCQNSSGSGFGNTYDGPIFSDATGWSALAYYASFRAASPLAKPPPACVPSPENCDGLDNDCNGLIDDGIDCTTSDPDAGVDDNILDEDAGGPDYGEDPDDAGEPLQDDAGAVALPPDAGHPGTAAEGGCACRTSGSGAAAAGLLVVLALSLGRRRRARTG